MSDTQAPPKTKTIKLIGGPRDGEIDIVEEHIHEIKVPWLQPDGSMISTKYTVDFIWSHAGTFIELWLWEKLTFGEAAARLMVEYKKPADWKPREVAKAMASHVGAVLNTAIGLERIDPKLITLINKTITHDLRKLKSGQKMWT